MAPLARPLASATSLLRRQTLAKPLTPVVTSVRAYSDKTSRPGHGKDPSHAVPDPSHAEIGEKRRHVNDVNETDGHNYDIQSEAAHASKSERAAGTGASQATTQKGGAEFANKAKKEHPKAPEPIIGMNEERGGKGH